MSRYHLQPIRVPYDEYYPWLSRNAKLLILKGGLPSNPTDEDFEHWHAYLDDQDQRKEILGRIMQKINLYYQQIMMNSISDTKPVANPIIITAFEAAYHIAGILKDAFPVYWTGRSLGILCHAMAKLDYYKLACSFNQPFIDALEQLFIINRNASQVLALKDGVKKANAMYSTAELTAMHVRHQEDEQGKTLLYDPEEWQQVKHLANQ